MKTPLNRILIAFLLLIPTISKADGQGFLEWVSDIFDLIFVFTIWTLGVLFLFLILKAFGKEIFNKRKRLSIWIIGLLLAFILWVMIKHDPYPNSGPIDSVIYKDKINERRIDDSLELINGKPDSTIETTIASIDTNKIGVYIWINNEKKFVRKLTPGLNQRQEDSLTMSIVRSWKQK